MRIPDPQKVVSILFASIQNIPTTRFNQHLELAIRKSPDPDDAAYLALAHHLGCPLWSDDKSLQEQDLVQVISTQKLIRANNR